MVRKEKFNDRQKFNDACQWREVVDLVGDKWSVLILRTLCHRRLRYSELHKQIEGISQKVLTASLRNLERNGLINRTVYPVVPPKVEYESTDLGCSVFDVVDALHNWSLEHLPDITKARRRYDKQLLIAALPHISSSVPRVNPVTRV